MLSIDMIYFGRQKSQINESQIGFESQIAKVVVVSRYISPYSMYEPSWDVQPECAQQGFQQGYAAGQHFAHVTKLSCRGDGG